MYSPILEVRSFCQRPNSQNDSQFIGIQSQAQSLSIYYLIFKLFQFSLSIVGHSLAFLSH